MIHHHHHHKVHHIAPAPKVPTFLPVEGEPGEPSVVILKVTDEGPEIEWAEHPATPEELQDIEEENVEEVKQIEKEENEGLTSGH